MKHRLSYWAAAVVAALSIIATTYPQGGCGLLVEEAEGYWDVRQYIELEHNFFVGTNRQAIRYSKLWNHVRRVQLTSTKIEAFAWRYSLMDNFIHYSWGLYALDQWGETFVADFRIESYAHIGNNTIQWKTNVVRGPFHIYGLGSDIFGSRVREYVDAHGRPVKITEDCSYSYILSNTNDVLNCSKTFSFVANGNKWSGMKTRQMLNVPHGETVVWGPSLCAAGDLTATWLKGVGSYCDNYVDGITPPETGCMYGW